MSKNAIAPPDPTPAQIRAREKKPDAPREEAKTGGFLDGVTRRGFRMTDEELQKRLDEAEKARQDGRGFVAEAVIAEGSPELKDMPRLSDDKVTFLRQVCVLFKATQELKDYTINDLKSSPLLCGSLVKHGYLNKTKFGFRATSQAHEWRRLVGVVSMATHKRKPKDAHLPRQGVTTAPPEGYVAPIPRARAEKPAGERVTRSRTPSTVQFALVGEDDHRVAVNPHRPGTDYHGYFEALRGGGTVDEYVARGGHRIAFAKYLKNGTIKLEE